MTFEKVLTLWIMIKTMAKNVRDISKTSKKFPVGSKIKRHFAKSSTKTFWPQALKPHAEVTSHRTREENK